MKRSRFQTVVILVVVAGGLLAAAIFGLFAYMSLTATPLHPHPQDVRSVALTDGSPAWAEAVKRGQQIARVGLSEQNLPGISVAVGVDGAIVWAEGFGWADLETRAAVTPETRFRIGTASTALTSAAVGLLLEKRALTLDEPIQTYVPEFPSKPWPVTVRQLMAHVAGVRNDSGDEGPLFGIHCERPIDALEVFKDRDLLFEPGTSYRYSSYGWILLSAAVEAASGEPFFTVMRKQIFDPLGMEGTRPDSMTVRIPNLATPYFPQFGGDPRYGADVSRPIDLSCYAGAGAFVSTPSDLARFAMAMNSGALLHPDTVRLLQTPQRLPSGADTGYGLGWDFESVTVANAETRVVGHDGDILGGMVASVWTFPDQGLVVSVVSNISYADTYGIAVKIAEAFAAEPQ